MSPRATARRITRSNDEEAGGGGGLSLFEDSDEDEAGGTKAGGSSGDGSGSTIKEQVLAVDAYQKAFNEAVQAAVDAMGHMGASVASEVGATVAATAETFHAAEERLEQRLIAAEQQLVTMKRAARKAGTFYVEPVRAASRAQQTARARDTVHCVHTAPLGVWPGDPTLRRRGCRC